MDLTETIAKLGPSALFEYLSDALDNKLGRTRTVSVVSSPTATAAWLCARAVCTDRSVFIYICGTREGASLCMQETKNHLASLGETLVNEHILSSAVWISNRESSHRTVSCVYFFDAANPDLVGTYTLNVTAFLVDHSDSPWSFGLQTKSAQLAAAQSHNSDAPVIVLPYMKSSEIFSGRRRPLALVYDSPPPPPLEVFG
jgi:hypothetical protein